MSRYIAWHFLQKYEQYMHLKRWQTLVNQDIYQDAAVFEKKKPMGSTHCLAKGVGAGTVRRNYRVKSMEAVQLGQKQKVQVNEKLACSEINHAWLIARECPLAEPLHQRLQQSYQMNPLFHNSRELTDTSHSYIIIPC